MAPALLTSSPLLRVLPFVGLGLVAFAWGVARVHGFVIDDAGISYAYALHLAEGEGLRAVVGGPVVEGYSNFLWVLLLAGAHRLGASIPTAAEVLGVAFGLGAGLVGLLAVHLDEGEDAARAPYTHAIPPLFLGLTPTYVVWVVSGLENGLFALLLAATVVLDLREARDPGARPYSALTALLSCLARPEGLLYAGLLGLLKAGHALVAPEHRRAFVAFALALLVPLALYHAAHYAVFRDVFPNTYYAKDPDLAGSTMESGARYLLEHFRQSGALPWTPLVVLGLVGPLRERALLAAFLGAFAFFTLYSGGDWMPHGRFLSFGAPLFAVALHLGVRRCARWLRRASSPARPWVGGALLVAGLSGLLLYWAPSPLRGLRAIEARGWCHFCNRLEDEARLDALTERLGLPMRSVLIHDFGAASYRSSPTRYAFDSLGLADRTLARLAARSSGPERFAADRARLRYLFHEQDRPPLFLYVPQHFWPGIRETSEYRQSYWELPLRHLSAVVRPGTVFALHRRAFVDFFPDLPRFAFLPLDSGLLLLGHRLQRSPEGLRVELVVLRRPGAPARPGARVSARLAGSGGEPVRGVLLGGDADLHRQWAAGEPVPLTLELEGPVPERPVVEVAVEGSGAPPSWVPLTEVPVGAPGAGADAIPPRFPVLLPAPADPALRALAPRVYALGRARVEARDERVSDPALGERLLALATELEEGASGTADDAYLAAVWAVQVDRTLDARLYDEVMRLRPDGGSYRLAMELALLRAFYREGDLGWAARLATFYRETARPELARYFEARATGPAWPAGGAARAPAGVDADFEAPGLSGWVRSGTGFVAGLPRGGVEVLDGHEGASMLVSSGGAASLRAALGARGRVESAPFALEGALLSFAVGGRGRGPAVELVVDGEAVRRFEGPLERHLDVVWWDVSAWSGRAARIVVVDDSPSAVIAVDRFRLWE